MILLKQAEGIKDRVVHGVAFINGKAILPDHLMAKAEFIKKFHNVTITRFDPKDTDLEDLSEEDLSTALELDSEEPDESAGNVSVPLGNVDEDPEVDLDTEPEVEVDPEVEPSVDENE